MFLLNDQQIVDYKTSGLLRISPFQSSFLHGTYYVFGLGRHFECWDRAKKEFQPGVLRAGGGANVLKIPERGYARIVSREHFELSSKVTAIFGQLSDLAAEGLRLNHGPFIDPGFEGNLQIGIENLLDRPVFLSLNQPIGKISFYDISDTYPIRKPSQTMSAAKFLHRQQLDDAADIIWSNWGVGE